MKNYRTMYDDLFCPCCVCEALAKGETLPTCQSIEAEATQDSVTDSPEGINLPHALVTEIASSLTDSLLSSHSSLSYRSVRLSMDGSINERHYEQPIQEVQTREDVALSPRRNIRRIVSLEPQSLGQVYELDAKYELEGEGKPQSLSRLELKSPRQPRAQRRCSVTKFSLEDALLQVQQGQSRQPSCRLAPCIEEEQGQPQEQEPRRHRVRRRCSVTKYSLDDVLQVVQQEDKEMTNSLSSCPEEPPLKELELSGHGLVASPESKRTFKARLPWGRAA